LIGGGSCLIAGGPERAKTILPFALFNTSIVGTMGPGDNALSTVIPSSYPAPSYIWIGDKPIETGSLHGNSFRALWPEK